MSFVAQPARPRVAEPLIDERESLLSPGPRSYDAIVRANIQTIRGNLQSIEANLRNLNRNFISRRIVESLHDKLKQTFEVILQTETTFKAWLQEQQQTTGSAQEALEKQRDKFLFEKLFAHFQAEIRRVQELSEKVRDAAERAADPVASRSGSEGLSDEQPTSHFQSSGVILDMENAGAYGDAGDADSLFISEDPREIAEFDFVSENDALLSRAVAEERFQGIRRIHAQVSQANHIFKDLANLIFSQGETLNSIETQMQDAHAHSKSATLELRKASRMQQRSRQRRCFLVLFICVLVFLILYSLNVFSVFAFLRSSTVGTEPLSVAVGRGGPVGESRAATSSPEAAPSEASDEAPSVSMVNEKLLLRDASPPATPAVPSAREVMEAGFRPQLPAS